MITFIFILSFLFNSDNAFINETAIKIKLVTGLLSDEISMEDKVHNNEPQIFTSFEVFDRAALNFFYFNKLYILSGTGPNLISIPSSPYINNKAYAIYGNSIDSVPHMFLINLLSRSGLFGIFLWFVFFIKFNFKKTNKNSPNIYFNLLYLFHFLVYNPVFFIYIAIVTSKKLNYK